MNNHKLSEWIDALQKVDENLDLDEALREATRMLSRPKFGEGQVVCCERNCFNTVYYINSDILQNPLWKQRNLTIDECGPHVRKLVDGVKNLADQPLFPETMRNVIHARSLINQLPEDWK